MALTFQEIQPTDKLQSGFRAKFNLNVDNLIIDGSIGDDGVLTLQTQGGVDTVQVDLSDVLATQDYVNAAISALNPSTTKIEIDKTQDDIVEDGAGTGNWYIEYREGPSTPIADGVMPYLITYAYNDGANDVLKSVPASAFEDNGSWSYPRIYAMPDPTTAATILITIYAI